MTAATIDDNSKAERARRVTLALYHRTDRDLDAQAALIAGKKKSNRLNAKASGVPSSQLDHLLKSFKAEDQQKPVDKLKRDMENLAYLGLIPDPTIKGDLFTRVDRVDSEGMIKAKGFFAGLNGLDRVSGYDGGSSDDRLWLDSYDAGKTEYETEIPDIIAKIEAAASKEEPPAGDDDPFESAGYDPFAVAGANGRMNWAIRFSGLERHQNDPSLNSLSKVDRSTP